MALELQGKVGPQVAADAAYTTIRTGRAGEVVVQDAHARHYEAVKRGNVFHAGTGAAGTAPGTVLSTTAAFTVYNPAGSGKDLVILSAQMGYLSGTIGAGLVVYAANNNPIAAAVAPGTALIPMNALLGGAAGVGKAFTAATVPATPTILRPAWSLTAILASTAVGIYQCVDNVDGAIVVAPGCAISLEGIAAAGSTPLVLFGMTWEEVPV